MKNNMKHKIKLLSFMLMFISTFLFISCNQTENNQEPDDGPTYGKIRISVDETFKYIIDTQVSTFTSIYDRAEITVSYKPESEAINDLLLDSVRLVVSARELTSDEKKVIEDAEIVPRTIKIAYDAIALIINPQSNDTLIKYDQVAKIFTGEIKTWKQINPKSKGQNIQVVFDNSNSSAIRYFKDLVGKENFKNNNIFAVKNSEAVIEHVSKNKNAIGFLGVGWVSDRDDTTCLSFLRKIKVMDVAPPDTGRGAGDYYKPFQAYIAQRFYPFMRTIYIVSREPRAGLGSGFMSFISSDRGQRIFLKSGLVPATAPIRLVEVYHEEL
jgi:phosphate transport system substrate-binding protein